MTFRSRRGFVGLVVGLSLTATAVAFGGGSAGAAAKPPVANRAGALRLGIVGTPGQWDPIKSSSTGENAYFTAVYDQLITIGPDGKTITPMLATSYSVSADHRAVTFELRRGVKFADGTSFDAKAVKFNLDRALSSAASSLVKNAMAGVTSVEAQDSDTIVLRLNTDGATLPLTIAVTPQLGMTCPSMSAATLTRSGCGTGPYQLVSQRQSGADFRRVPNYWDKAADARAPERLTIFGVNDQNARINGLVSGQYDAIALFGATQGDLKSIPTNRFNTFALDPQNRYYELGLNTSKAPLNDPKVWQAVNLALDRKGIASLFAKGTCTPTAQMATKGKPGYVKALDTEAVWGQDIKAAKKLMAQAGQEDGFSLKITTLTTLQTLASAIQAQLGEIGIKVSIETVPTSLAAAWLTGKYGMWITAFAGSPDLYTVANSLFGAAQSVGPIPQQFTDYINIAGRQAIGSRTRDNTWQSFNRYLVSNPRNPIICATSEVKAASKNVIGMENPGLGTLSAALDPRYLGIAKK